MPQRRSLIGPLVLVGFGLLLLYSSLRSNWGAWEVVWRYWPLILIAWGAGKLWDHLRTRNSAEPASPARFSGGEIGMAIALVALVALAIFHKPSASPASASGSFHFSQTVQAQGAKTVHADIVLGAGDLNISGGSSSLLEADCSYNRSWQVPHLRYEVAGTNGNLVLRESGENDVHFGFGNNEGSTWNLRVGNQVPVDLAVKLGAGTGRLYLSGVPLTHLHVAGGAGKVYVDLSGDWKQSFDGRIAAGVGTITVRLPTTVGVRVHARGGLGSVEAPGMQREGDVYENAAYGKSPITLDLDVSSGIGTINLESGR
jgi:hypothetical protein